MPKRLCKQFGCRELTDDGHCDQHREQLKREKNQFLGSAASRGYDRKHRKLRDQVFREQKYLCPECLKQGRAVLCTQLHHIKKIATHPHLRLVRSNVVGLCGEHHEAAEKLSE